MAQRLFGPDERRVADAHNSLGTLLYHSKRSTEAEKHLEIAIDIRRRRLGPEHTQVASGLTDLGAVRSGLGRHDDAVACFQEAVRIDRKRLGPGPDLGGEIAMLGRVLQIKGDRAAAERAFREALTMQIGAKRQEALTGLAEICASRGEHGAAEGYAREALALVSRAWGPSGWQAHCATCIISNAVAEQGCPQEVEALQRFWLEKLLAKVGPDHLATAHSMKLLGSALIKQKRFVEAEFWLRRALPPFERAPSEEWHCLWTRSNLATLNRSNSTTPSPWSKRTTASDSRNWDRTTPRPAEPPDALRTFALQPAGRRMQPAGSQRLPASPNIFPTVLNRGATPTRRFRRPRRPGIAVIS